MTTDYLSFGDKICLYCENTNGFINSNYSSSLYNELRVFNNQDKFNPSQVTDIQTIVFEVVIPNRYKLYKKYIKNYGNSNGAGKQFNNTNDDNVNLNGGTHQDLEFQLQEEQAKASVVSEEDDNALEQRRNLGKAVHYGDEVQLRHIFTKKYIHVNSSKMSSLDKNSMKLVLQDHNSKSAQFKIVPRYKVKYEGEIVQYMDLVTFESIKSPSHYFHCSQLCNIDNLFYGAELNLSIDQSGFTLIRSSKAIVNKNDDESQQTKTFLQTGDYVQLIHKEIDGYIQSWGSSDFETKPEVKLRLRRLKKTSTATNYKLSLSAVTFWQIEQEKINLSTNEGRWSGNFRFRHATNRLYLCIKENSMKVSLSKKPRADTVFKLHPQSNDNEKISYGSVFRLEHVLTGTWMHGMRNKSENYESRLDKNQKMDKTLSNLEWEDHEFLELKGVKQRLYDDAFVIYQVNQDNVDSFNKLSGHIPLLQNLLIDRLNKVPYAASKSYALKLALEEIRDDLLINGKPAKARQRHLRNLELVDTLVKLVLVDFFDELDEAFTKKIYQACYEILHNYMKGDSRKNCLYFAKYIDLFIPKMLANDDLGRKVTEMITELVKDNSRVLECIKFENIIPFIESLRVNQNSRFLEYLMKFCVCNGEALVTNQSNIATKWLTEDLQGVYLTDRGQNLKLRTDVIYIKTGFNCEWLPLDEFLNEQHPGFNRNEKDYFLKQIDLILAICHGRNAYCINLVLNRLNYLSWEECYAAIRSDLLPCYMKKKYFEIMETMFIDIGSNYAVIDSPKYNFNYQQIHSEQPMSVECMFPIPSERITNRIFTDLSNWIFEFLESQSTMFANKVDLNYLTQIVLEMCNKLIQYGYFNTDNIVRLLNSLLLLLNGKLDLPFEFDAKKDTSKHRKKIVSKFKSKLRYEDSTENLAIVSAKLAGLQVLESILIYERVSVVSQLISKFKKCDRPDSKVQRRRLKGHTHLIECLEQSFDIDNLYKTSRTRTKKMVLEIQNIFQNASFISPEKWTTILLDLAYYKSGNMNQMSLLILHKLYTIKDSTFIDTYSTFISCTNQSQELQERLCEYIPKLKLMTKSAINLEHIDSINLMIKDMISVCRIAKNNDVFNPISQRIIIGYGILDVSVDIISQLYRSFEKSQMPLAATSLIVMITDLLRHLAVANSSFQEDLFNRLDSLMDLYTSHSFPPIEFAEMLRQGIFLNNRGFCGRLKPYQLNRLVNIIAKTARTQPRVGGAFVHLLETLATLEDGHIPLKRNQLLIMKFLMKSYSQIVYVLDSKSNDTLTLLTANSSYEDAMYFNRIVDLFVACCQGENQYVQSLCQTIIPLDELLKLLVSPDVHDTFKRGLLGYFCKVYLSKTSIVNQEGAVKNFLASKFSDELLESIEIGLQRTQNILSKSDQFNLLPLFKKQFIMKPPTQFQIAETIQLHLQTTIYGTAVFMASFCGACFFLHFQMSSAMYAKVGSINRKILDIFSSIFKFQLRPNIISIITESLLKIVPYSGLSDIEAKTMIMSHCKPKILDIDPRKEIDEVYAKEIELNLRLQTFLFNCSHLISGRNTVKAQLHINNDKEYVDVRDQVALPLSLDFQSHMRAFLSLNQQRGEIKRYRNIEVLIRQLEASGHQFRSTKGVQFIKSQDRDALNLRCLQILRGLIYNEEVLLPDDWESRLLDVTVQEPLKGIKQVQNALNSLNVSNRTQLHMVNPCDAVRKEVVTLQSAMLMNANVKVQDSMLKYFHVAKDEVFFGAIKYQLQDAFDDLKDQKLMAVAKRILLNIDNLELMNSLCAVDVIELRNKLLQQMVNYEARFTEHHQSLAINESFTMRKIRQLLMPKTKTRSRNLCLCCLPNKKSYMMGSEEIERSDSVEIFEQTGSEYDLDTIIMKQETGTANFNHKTSKKRRNNSSQYTTASGGGISNPATDNDSIAAINSVTHQQDMAMLARGDPQQQVKLVLQLLSRMCVGQYNGLQNYLRCQPDNQTSVDVVSLVVHFLGNIYASITPTTIDLNVLAFDTIKEAILGNQENRSVVYRAKVVDYANFILRGDDIIDSCDQDKLLNLYSVIGRVIFALIEENGKEESGLVKEIKITLDVKAIFKAMTFCQNKVEKCKNSIIKEGFYEVGFNYFLILARFEDLDGGRRIREAQPSENQVKAFRFFKKGEASIEILKNDELQRIHFRLRSKEVLRESVREKVKWEVDRTTPSNKIRSFTSWSKLIIPDMSFQRKIIGNSLLLFLTKKWDMLNYLMTLISFIICILLLIGVKAPGDGFIGLSLPSNRSSQFDNKNITYKSEFLIFDTVIKGLAASHAVICLLLLLTYVITDRATLQTFIGYYRTVKQYLLNKFKKDSYSDDSANDDKSSSVSLFSMVRFLYCLICFGLSIYGFYIPYVYAFYLFNIVHNNQLLKGVIGGVTTNGRVLIWVTILMVFVMYIFAIIGFCFYRSMFDPSNFLYGASLIQTFVTIIRFGFVADLYENMMPNDAEKTTIDQAFNQFFKAVGFHLIFFIIIAIIGLNIVFGIIVDTFSELRDLKFKAEKDMKEMCFICSRPGHDFDQTRSSFNYHVTNEHNMWAYLFYFLQLKEKKISDYYHLDLYVFNMLKKENYDFFPINRALALISEEEHDTPVDDICRTVRQVTEYRKSEAQENRFKLQMMQNRLWHHQNQPGHLETISNSGSEAPSIAETDPTNTTTTMTNSLNNRMFQRMTSRFKSPFL